MIDYFTVWHIIGTFAFGLLVGFFIKKWKKAVIFAIVLPSFWEVFEQNVLVSWIGLLEPESLLNSFSDIMFGIVFILLGFATHKVIMKKIRK